MAGGYSGANRTLINTVFKAVPRMISRIVSQPAATQLDPDDIKNAPRILTPVLALTDIVSGGAAVNGFVKANLRPGDIVTWINSAATGADAWGIMIRGSNNTSWIKITMHQGTGAVTASVVTPTGD